MPSQRLILATVAFDPGEEIPLGTSRIEVHPSLEPEAAQPAHANILPLGQMKDRDVRTALHHTSVEATTPQADRQRAVLSAGALRFVAFGHDNNLHADACPLRSLPVHSLLVLTDINETLNLSGALVATTKKDLINRITESTASPHALVKAVVQRFFDEVTYELAQGNRLEFRDFGVFETKTTPARMAQNPRTLQKVEVPAKRRVTFRPGKSIRLGLNGSDDNHKEQRPT